MALPVCKGVPLVGDLPQQVHERSEEGNTDVPSLCGVEPPEANVLEPFEGIATQLVLAIDDFHHRASGAMPHGSRARPDG